MISDTEIKYILNDPIDMFKDGLDFDDETELRIIMGDLLEEYGFLNEGFNSVNVDDLLNYRGYDSISGKWNKTDKGEITLQVLKDIRDSK